MREIELFHLNGKSFEFQIVKIEKERGGAKTKSLLCFTLALLWTLL